MTGNVINLGDFSLNDWTIQLNNRVITRFCIREGERLVIGRGADADVIINNSAVSRHHSAIELRNGTLFISDLSSLNGTTVNGTKITSAVPISLEDKVGIGKFGLTPASESAQEVSSSYAMSMDMEDETVFVSSPKRQQPKQQIDKTASEHRLMVISGDATPTELSLDGKASVKIGKDSSCDIIINSWLVAKAQCFITNKSAKHYIIPQRSWTTTKLNDVSITEERLLRPGDTIEIRRVKIRYN